MRILVFSDTHKDISNCIDVLSKVKADMFIHLGDMHNDYSDLSAVFSDIISYEIYGNNEVCFGNPSHKIIEVEGFRLLFTHGHTFGVKSGLSRLLKAAKENDAHLVLFGHTHQSFSEKIDGIQFLNPGSANNRYGTASYGVIEIEDGNLRTAIIKV